MMDQSELSRKLQANRLLSEQQKLSKRAVNSLNLAQFLAVLNDNLLKFLTIYFLIDLKGIEFSSSIIFLVGVFFVLPFLLFSGYSGMLADKYSKQKIIVYMKAFELAIVCFGFFMFYYKLEWGSYITVFLLCLQSTLMGPAKYSIIPEIVKKDCIAKTNGLITGCSYLAMIAGSFFASFITQITMRNFSVAILACILSATVGFIASLYIPKTSAKPCKKKLDGMGFVQIAKTLQTCRRTPLLLLAVLGSSFFLFIGAFLQLNLIPFATSSLGMDEVTGGYLFSVTAIGIALGSTLAGRFCKKEVHLGLPPFALAAMGILLALIPCFVSSVGTIAILLGLLGLMGGLYEIPFESYMQTFSASESRGKVVAAANWLCFVGVLLAPLTLGFFGSVLNLPPSVSFIMLTVIIFVIFASMMRHLSVPLYNFISQSFFHPFYDIHYLGFPFGQDHQEEKMALVSKRMPLRYLTLIIGESTKLHLFIVRAKRHWYDRFLEKLAAIDFLYQDDPDAVNPEKMTEKIVGLHATVRPLLIFPNTVLMNYFSSHDYFVKLERDHHYSLKTLTLRNTAHFRPTLRHLFKRVQLVFAFDAMQHSSQKAPSATSDAALAPTREK